MSETLKPDTVEQITESVLWAVSNGMPLEVISRATKRDFGNPVKADHILDVSTLSGTGLYEPEELVMTALPGTPLVDVEKTLADKRQQLAFEPADLGPLLGGEAGQGSIAGVFACNLSGPRRLLSGAARDHILGFQGVSGRGELFKSGGRVVKNVTGFDLSKLMTGAFGTLGVFTELTFKVLPMAEKSRTVLVSGATDAAAIAAMRAAVNSSNEVSGAAHLPQAVAARSDVSYVADAGTAITAVRVEGPGPSVAARCDALRDMLASFGDIEELHTMNTNTLWREIRDVTYFTGDTAKQVWRLSVAPTKGAAVAAGILAHTPGEAFYDWGGGQLWLALDPGDDAHATMVRRAVGAEGHATLIRASEAVRAAVPVFQPQVAALGGLTERVKAAFDPDGILNPGRMG